MPEIENSGLTYFELIMCGNKNSATMKTLSRLALLLVAVVFAGCDRTRMDKGLEYFPDMAHSPAYKTWSANEVMDDGKTMREPVAGTVPRDMEPYPYANDFEGRALAGKNLKNPLKITPQLLEEGKELYRVFCQQCHGEAGDGKGSLHTSGKYIIPPSSLLTPEFISLPEGETYHVISVGWGVMGAHASLIRPEDRWKIVAFIEQVLQEK